jgi:hypothetical protein
MAESYKIEELLAMTRDGLRDIGYRDELLRTDYRFADVLDNSEPTRTIPLAAFAQEPPSYRNACFGIVEPRSHNPDAIQQYLALGAPQILALHPEDREVHLWRMAAQGKPALIERIHSDQLRAKIRSRKDEWNPDHILRAKSIGFSAAPTQLDFFDIGLVPALEEVIQKKLDILLRDVIASSMAVFTETHGHKPGIQDTQALFRLIFRLLAAKLLIDRRHEGFRTNADAQSVLAAIESFYFHDTLAEDVLKDREIQSLAWEKIRGAFLFQNISVEALAYVYENTLVSAETRKQLDTHATPPEIAEYIVRQLPFEALAQDDRKVFEPFAGHAPFLIAALGRLRTLLPSDMRSAQRHDYFVSMLSGMEIDSFAREVARYSLILADYPNPDGWRIENADVFTSPKLDSYLSDAHIVLCNPPYGDFTPDQRRATPSIQAANKAVEALRRVLQRPPRMLGFVLPRVFVNGQSYRQTRREIANHYDDISLIGLPDVAFQHSEVETVLLIAHGTRTDQPKWRSALVTKNDYQQFTRTDNPTWIVDASSISLGINNNPLLWITPLTKRLSDTLGYLSKLGEILDIHRGFEYSISFDSNAATLVSDMPRSGFMKGLVRVKEGFEPYNITTTRYLNNNPSIMLYEAYKRPWHRPKIIANAARISEGPWTLAGAIDYEGIACYQNFHGIWPRDNLPLEVIAAVLNGPVANAFVSTHRTSRHNQKRAIQQIPVPNFTEHQQQSIVTLVYRYHSYREQWLAQPDRGDYFERLCLEIMWQIDAEVLAAYDLPPRLERELLDYFAGHERPGPVKFDRYYPPDFRPAIPLRDYISEEFRSSTARRTLERLPVLQDPVISAMVEDLD